MRREDLIAYASRDWSAIAEEKTRAWLEARERRTATESLLLSGTLRDYVQSLHPDWPTESDRHEDLLHHQRVSKALQSVCSGPRRSAE